MWPKNRSLRWSAAKTKKIVILGVLLAMEIVLSRFLSISTPVLKIGFNFVPIVVVAIAYGPLYSAILAGLGDFIGALLFPIGPYFPGFTLSAFITGLVFGIMLYKHPLKPWRKSEKEGAAKVMDYVRLAVSRWWRAVLGPVIIGIVVTLLLDPLWLMLLYDKAFMALIPARLIKLAVMVPLQAIVTVLLCYRVAGWINKASK